MSEPSASSTPLSDIARTFLLLGVIGFGGPAAHIALMEREVVRRREWLTRAEFLDLMAMAHLIPGPNSTELALAIGRARRGVPGLLVAGACFIGPAVAIVLAIAWAYVRFGRLPAVGAILHGVQPVMVAVVAQALVALAPTALRGRTRMVVAALALAAALAGVHELIVLAAGAALGVAMGGDRAGPRGREPGAGQRRSTPGLIALAGPLAAGTPPAFGLAPLFGVFLKVGALLFGSGYVLLAFLRGDLVERLRWMTERQLLDAIAVGQFTPGPVFTTATFVGYVLGGWAGATVATVGIFLPAFVYVAVALPFLPRLRASRTASAALDGVMAASLALVAAVLVPLAGAAIVDAATASIAAFGLLLLLRTRIHSGWLVVAAGLAGWLLRAAPR